jgi:hypothetical protein
MLFRRWLVRRSILLTTVVVACERSKRVPAVDTTVESHTLPVESVGVAQPHWDPAAGPLLLVAGESPTEALVVTADSASGANALAAVPRPAAATLLGRGGTIQQADLEPPADASVCRPWIVAAAPPPRPWSVGFIGGVVAPLAMDSVESLGHADSLALAVAATRLASALPNDSAGRFAGLPFTVRSLWRFSLPAGQHVLVATLQRQINQEATPLEERTLVVAERDPRDSTFHTAYAERSSGREETVESGELLSAILIGANRRPAIVLSRDYGDAVAHSFLERADNGMWRMGWTSPRRRC